MAEVFRGNVVRIEADGPYVTCSDLGIGTEFGPCETTMPVSEVLAEGNRVLVCTIADVIDDVVIVGRLRTQVAP
jgi:hypothetical protein